MALDSIKFGSVCSGIEAASVAWHPLGWEPAWFAEIEPFPSAVLAHHYPDVPNLGDMTTIAARVAAGEVESPDVLVGGTPCQAFSVAGLRGGLSDARGQLTLSYVELLNAIDSARYVRGQQPAVAVWENVPGVLSSKDNAFGCFLGALAGEDCELQPPGRKWSNAGCVFGPQRAVAWRILDAQYFGVAQRRRRVFVVASARAGFDPAAVLFEFEGLRRDSAPSREPGQGAAADVAPSLVSSGRGVERIGGSRGQDPVVAVPAEGCWWDGGQVSQTLDAVLAKGQTMPEKNRFPAVLQPVGNGVSCLNPDQPQVWRVYDPAGTSPALQSEEGRGNAILQHGVVAFSCKDYGADAGPISPTLRAMGHGQSHANAGGQVAVAFDSRQDPVSSEHVFGSLNSSSPQAQAIAVRTANTGANGHGISPELCHTLDGANGQAVAFSARQDPVIAQCLTTGTGQRYDPETETLLPVAFNSRQDPVSGDVSGALDTCSPQAQAVAVSLRGRDGGGQPAACMTPQMAVRRLTPRECERLQGFPDRWTDVPYRNKPAADGPRYKALGNSMAVPCMHWIGRRLSDAIITMDSMA